MVKAKKIEKRFPKNKEEYKNFGRRGNPTVISKEMIEEFKRLIPTHYYMETVACAMGISRQTIWHWRKWGKAEQRRLQDPHEMPDPNKELYLEFHQVYYQATAQALGRAISRVDKASKTNWMAAAWLAERSRPDLWGHNNHKIRELEKNMLEIQKHIMELSLNKKNTT